VVDRTVRARRLMAGLALIGAVALVGCEPPPPPPSQQLQYQGNATHTGVTRTTISPTARVRWTHDFALDESPNATLGTPLIDGDLVIVPSGTFGHLPDADPGDEAIVTAFDRATGTQRWRTTLGDASIPALSGVNGRIFASTGALHALDEATGAILWSTKAGGIGTPTAVGDAVYAPIVDTHDSVARFDPATGATVWTTELSSDFSGGSTPVAVTSDAVIFSARCNNVVSLRPNDGAVQWVTPSMPHGGGSGTVVANGRVYVTGCDTPSMFDASTGSLLGYVFSYTEPVVDGDHMYVIDNKGLSERSADGLQVRYRRSTGAGNAPVEQPLLVGDTLFAVGGAPGLGTTAGDHGTLFGWRASDGAQTFAIPLPFTHRYGTQAHTIAAAPGTLAVPFGTSLVVIS
jgi:outer membrane protein assembly factor BamB